MKFFMGPEGGQKNMKFLMGPGWAKNLKLLMGPGWPGEETWPGEASYQKDDRMQTLWIINVI